MLRLASLTARQGRPLPFTSTSDNGLSIKMVNMLLAYTLFSILHTCIITPSSQESITLQQLSAQMVYSKIIPNILLKVFTRRP